MMASRIRIGKRWRLAAHSQRGKGGFQGFPSHVVEVNVYPLRRGLPQMLRVRSGLVVESHIEPAFLPRRTGKDSLPEICKGVLTRLQVHSLTSGSSWP
jgi:hypothetical protein